MVTHRLHGNEAIDMPGLRGHWRTQWVKKQLHLTTDERRAGFVDVVPFPHLRALPKPIPPIPSRRKPPKRIPSPRPPKPNPQLPRPPKPPKNKEKEKEV